MYDEFHKTLVDTKKDSLMVLSLSMTKAAEKNVILNLKMMLRKETVNKKTALICYKHFDCY